MPTTFLTGPAGTGKTTYAVSRLRELLADNIPASSILVLVPQLTLAQPYRDSLSDPSLPGTGPVDVLTLNGLALKTIDLFWPLGAVSSGYGRPHQRPVFLNIETAQYYLWQAIEPLLNQGYFDPNVVPVTISLPRLMSQILDNLNKAALIGLPHTQVGRRLAVSLAVDPGSRAALEHTQACVNHFREFCLARNLLDFSLRIETFFQHLWPVPGVQQFLIGRYRHLIVDNVEEDTPFAHTILRQWLPQTDSALLINDEEAGFRIFLGANWRTAQQLSNLADDTIQMTDSHVAPAEMLSFGQNLAQIIHNRMPKNRDEGRRTDDERRTAGQAQNSELKTKELPFTFEQTRFYPQAVEWVINQIEKLIKKGVSPNQIVVLAPFVSDALRFSFTHRMQQRGLVARSHRPSRPLSEEPAAKAMLTLARLAFPHWKLLPEPTDVAQTLSQVIANLDLIRADLLTQVIYRPNHPYPIGKEQLAISNEQPLIPAPTDTEPTNNQLPITNYLSPLTTFDQIEGPVRERISYQIGNHFDTLRAWLENIQADTPPVLDHFFSRLFGEVLSQPGFGFHGQQEAGQIVANLIDSARAFRRVAEQVPLLENGQPIEESSAEKTDRLNRAYLETIEQGIAAAQYIRGWESAAEEESVLITPATTFLMSNRPVDYQFWLDAGSSGWWERIAQPLTHPYILAADWEVGRPWTDEDEVFSQHDRLYRLVLGLIRRCRKHIYMVNSEVGEQGYEQRGQLLLVLQQMLRQSQRK